MSKNSGTLWVLLTGLTTLVSVQVSYWMIYFNKGPDSSATLWVISCGSLGFLFSELGAFFFADYYAFRETRGEQGSRSFLSFHLDPPQLGLKAGGAFFLFSFLFVMIILFSLFEKGWGIALLACLGAAFSYSWGAPPFYLRRVFFFKDFGRGLSLTLWPAWISSILGGTSLDGDDFLYLALLWVLVGVILHRLGRNWPR